MRPLVHSISQFLMKTKANNRPYSLFCTSTHIHNRNLVLFYYSRVRNSVYLLSRIVPMWRHVIVAKMGVMKG